MTGYINSIRESNSGLEYGFIVGDDGNSYYFDGNSLAGNQTMTECDVHDEVEFIPARKVAERKNIPAREVVLIKMNGNSSKIEEKSSIDADEEQKEKKDIVKYFKAGFATHLNKKYAYEQCLKPDSGEDIVVNKISKILYVSRLGYHVIDQRSRYQFCVAGATEVLKQYIRGKYEFLIIMSHFDNEDWQQKNLIVEREVRKRKEIADRRLLVNFYVLISNAVNLRSEIEKVKGGTSSAVIPFAFKEIIDCKSKDELSELFVTRFSEYLYENNMLGETTAIDDDNLLFGDRGKIADLIVSRCQMKSNSGIFGLRRSGKTSVLNAVMRRLERNGVKYIKIESRSELENLDSWKTALYDIARKIRKTVLDIEPAEGESRGEFAKRLRLNSTEEDYEKRPSYFIEDVKLYCKDEPIFVIAIDEVELITYNTAKTKTWKDVEAYCGFWGALRDCGCALIVCGVNSTINEINTISYNGTQGDNPMYGRIINCVDSSATYLPVFTDEQTKIMINTLGGYSNIGFSNVYTEINRAFGGQPYAVRQFCSYVFERVKHLRKPDELYEVSKASIENLLTEFINSAEGNRLCETILQHIVIFKDEYQMLKKIALAPENYRQLKGEELNKIDHLQKYGLIEYDSNTYYISFRIHSIRDYICKNHSKEPLDMTNEERRQYVQLNVANCERLLKKYIRDYFVYNSEEAVCRRIFKGYINSPKRNRTIMVNKKFSPISNPNTCKFKDFFDHKQYIIYFSSIRTIIEDNWGKLGKKFESVGIDRNKFHTCMEDLNAGRNDADHYDAEDMDDSPENWEIDDVTIQNFVVALNKMNTFLEMIK